MTNGSERLDRIERILELSAKRQEQFDINMEQSFKRQEQFDKGMEASARRQEQFEKGMEASARRQEQFDKGMEASAKRQEQFDKGIEASAKRQEQFDKGIAEVHRILREMAARQQYHDEAFERHDSELKLILEAIAAAAENIRALVRIAEYPGQRLEDLEGGGAV